MRYEIANGVLLEPARDCHGQPRLLRLDDANGLPATIDSILGTLAVPVALNPGFYWVDVPHRYRVYHVNGRTLRFVFRQRTAGRHAVELLELVGQAYQAAGRRVGCICPPELKEVFLQWDSEVTNC